MLLLLLLLLLFLLFLLLLLLFFVVVLLVFFLLLGWWFCLGLSLTAQMVVDDELFVARHRHGSVDVRLVGDARGRGEYPGDYCLGLASTRSSVGDG
jgi:hypothetical protein